jgi:UDP-N-acetylmuramoyl-L-alanyl-D-glutamate--2,6-diaminopimelate ligase
VSSSLDGLEFDAKTPAGVAHVRSRLVGRPNVYNILAAVAAAVALGVPLEAVERGVRQLAAVPGRFEVVSSPGDDITVVVDYAHTDDALRNLLETARPLTAGRLLTVFGAGGDRDRSKRPLMGMVAARMSDVVIVTSDNPRGEDPMRIIEEVKRGADPESRQGGGEVRVVVDRRAAIRDAIASARAGDVVLLAGKGHEKYQEIAGTALPFDDVAVARESLEARRGKARIG